MSLESRVRRGPGGRLEYAPAAGDVVELRRAHPCGSARMVVTEAALDVRLECAGCGARLTLTRQRLRARVRDVLSSQ